MFKETKLLLLANSPVCLSSQFHVFAQEGGSAQRLPAQTTRCSHRATSSGEVSIIAVEIIGVGWGPKRNHDHETQRLGGAVGISAVGIGHRQLVSGLHAWE